MHFKQGLWRVCVGEEGGYDVMLQCGYGRLDQQCEIGKLITHTHTNRKANKRVCQSSNRPDILTRRR